MAGPRVLNVGQCSMDHGSISRHLARVLGAETRRIGSAEEALRAARAGGVDLVLVNRVLDDDGSSGLDLIRDLKADPATADVPAMLVSDYPDAQARAVALGALPGFGKAGLTRPETLARLKALAAASSPDRANHHAGG